MYKNTTFDWRTTFHITTNSSSFSNAEETELKREMSDSYIFVSISNPLLLDYVKEVLLRIPQARLSQRS